MTKDIPMACSLGAGELEQRLAAIAEVGANNLISSDTANGSHLLRFRADTTTRRRLEGIVAAEAECCAFLDLSLSEKANELHLSIDAPENAQQIADELAGAFSRASRMSDQAAKPARTGALIGIGGLALAVCCIAAPAILGVAIGATGARPGWMLPLVALGVVALGLYGAICLTGVGVIFYAPR